MSNKILGHIRKEDIEKIILSCKIKGIGSVKIQGEIKERLGVELSRPTIDKYWKENLNGDLISTEIEKVRIEASSTPSGERGLVPPVVDLEKLDEIKEKYKQFGNASQKKLEEFRECLVLLMSCNLDAYISGEERLRIEYAKYLKDLDGIKKIEEND